jgi:hypothetical protein
VEVKTLGWLEAVAWAGGREVLILWIHVEFHNWVV